MEKETTGLYLSGHPMDAVPGCGAAAGRAHHRLAFWRTLPRRAAPRGLPTTSGSPSAGVVTSSKTKTTTQQLPSWPTSRWRTSTAAMELLCFARVLETCGSLPQGEPGGTWFRAGCPCATRRPRSSCAIQRVSARRAGVADVSGRSGGRDGGADAVSETAASLDQPMRCAT